MAVLRQKAPAVLYQGCTASRARFSMRAAAQVDLMIYAPGKETFRRRYGPAGIYLAVLLPCFFGPLGPTEA